MRDSLSTVRSETQAHQSSITSQDSPEACIVAYDENLLERARTQWQFGDWQSLAQLNRDILQHHPDRAKLALLAAAGRLQTDKAADAKQFIRLAQDWGISKKLIIQILIAGVHNSLGRAAAIGNQEHRALQHFEKAIVIGHPEADVHLLLKARTRQQIDQLGLSKAMSEQKKISIASKNAKMSVSLGSRSNKGDADIDDLVSDLEFFFNGRAITYVDVGAYLGDVFLKFKKSAKQFRIHEAHLFEPNPASYAQLKQNIGDQDAFVHLYSLAVGHDQDSVQFLAAKSMTKALTGGPEDKSGCNGIFTARCVSLDSQSTIFTDGKINLLKIDVEGKELDVLSSAHNMLTRQSVDIIYIEVGFNRQGTQQTYFADIDQFLQPLGYRVLRIYEQKEEWMSGLPLLRRANLAYVSEKFAEAHPIKLMQELHELKSELNELKLMSAL